mmetsp:Transcript_480/g.1126  ORF Transcript_480/g.1126 Transcript_480/m.1126 type:complete len:229 (+) Transcript_480:174-860(+)|eukprot:CAMPEP_0168280756 /NCGR_PEP_ID=MMETSP0141_2-20121125/21320_1 /TAXON_ID=44445 /ORGANISM="Pseudo-nitzschia australis, Strain 10249 10 AB" /LENGTH=228 /DNA_ID=CAMNT_0008224069 /DNA_START=105 /DNA_END=791 /DNA_ORIENTATION=+
MDANNLNPSESASAMKTLAGVMSSAKDKWHSSGANDAVSKFSASIPDSTKDYISQTTGQLFSRGKLRPVSVCFGVGEERAFYLEKTPSLLIARLKHNFLFFYLNYLVMLAVLFGLTLFVTPSAIIGIALLAMAWYYVIKSSQSGSLTIGAFSFSQTQATIGMGVISAFTLIWILSGVFWWALGSCGFLTALHASLRDASMHQDGEDQVTMVGEVEPAGEQAAFLGEQI